MQAEIRFQAWKECFSALPDPRVVGGTTRRLLDILFLTLCAVIGDMDDWEPIEEWCNVRLEWLRQFVPLENGIPSHDTIGRVFAALDSRKFEACFVRCVSALCRSLEGQSVAIDGKTARGSHDRGQHALHMVSAFVCSHGITLGQWKADEKSNEITAVPELIESLDLAGATVTLDAMRCQKTIAQALVDQVADYVFGLKGNQETPHEHVRRLFDVTQWSHYAQFGDWGHVTEGAGHGCVEWRRYVALASPSGEPYAAWAGLQSVIMVEAVRQTAEEVTAQTRYFVRSLPPDERRLAEMIHRHWEVENPLHWSLDVAFGEDACRTRRDHAPHNLNIVRKIAMNLLRLSPVKRSLTKKRLRAGLNPTYLGQIRGVP